jgi:homoserine kinase
VPATSANLGPGFDCLALALDLHNVIEVMPMPGGSLAIEVEGEGAEVVARDRSNLVVEAMQHLADAAGRPLPPFALRLCNAIPLGRGLGSSAASIAGGMVAAAALLDLPADPAALLPVALDLEGHPDNIAAALFGGFTVGVVDGATPVVHRVAPPPDLRAVVLLPDRFASTVESRAVLPPTLSRADAIYNSGRCALLALAIAEGRYDLLRVAMQDRLHQPQRGRESFPYLDAAIAAALAAGAHGAALSGSGSSVVALATEHTDAIATALAGVARDYRVPARTLVLAPAHVGAHHVTGGA